MWNCLKYFRFLFVHRWPHKVGPPTEGEGWELKFSYKHTQDVNGIIELCNCHKLLKISSSCHKHQKLPDSCSKVAEQLVARLLTIGSCYWLVRKGQGTSLLMSRICFFSVIVWHLTPRSTLTKEKISKFYVTDSWNTGCGIPFSPRLLRFRFYGNIFMPLAITSAFSYTSMFDRVFSFGETNLFYNCSFRSRSVITVTIQLSTLVVLTGQLWVEDRPIRTTILAEQRRKVAVSWPGNRRQRRQLQRKNCWKRTQSLRMTFWS